MTGVRIPSDAISMSIIVKKSKIHGKGVFASKDFKKGKKVIIYHLKPLTQKEFRNLPEKEKHFTSKIGKTIYLFPSPERYVNHSCTPNTHPNSKEKCDVAIRDIKKGEEITTDYRKDNVPNLSMKCRCGSKSCKKIIT